MPDLYRASFAGRPPRIRVSGGTVSLTFPGLWHAMAARGQVILNATIPWALEIRGGAAEMDADLSAVNLSELNMTGGASRVDLRLSRPAGTIPLRIRGGASRIGIHRPGGVPVRVRVTGGLSRLSLDAQRVGSVGSGARRRARGTRTPSIAMSSGWRAAPAASPSTAAERRHGPGGAVDPGCAPPWWMRYTDKVILT